MSLTTSEVPFNHLLATAFYKTSKKKKHKRVLHVFYILMKCGTILSLCSPQTLFQAFNQKPIRKEYDFQFII